MLPFRLMMRTHLDWLGMHFWGSFVAGWGPLLGILAHFAGFFYLYWSELVLGVFLWMMDIDINFSQTLPLGGTGYPCSFLLFSFPLSLYSFLSRFLMTTP